MPSTSAGRTRWRLSDNEYKPDSKSYPGNHFCNETHVRPIKLAWPTPQAKLPPYTTLRILPGFSPDVPGTPDATRVDDDLGEFIRCYPAWRGGGTKPVTFFCGNKQQDPAFDLWDTPPKILYNAVYRAVKKNQDRPDWEYLLNRHRDSEGRMRGAVIVSPKDMYVVQAIVYQHGDHVIDPRQPLGLGDRDKVQLVDLGSQAGRTLVELLRATHETENEDYAFTLIDPIALDSKHAKFFNFFDVKLGPQQFAGRSGRRNQPQSSSDDIGFGITPLSEFQGESPRYGADDIDVIMAKMQQWDDVLLFPSIERQAELLRGCIPWDVLEYAWQDHPEWLPQDCPEAEAARAKVSSGYTRREADNGDDDDEAPSTGTMRSRPTAGADDVDDDAPVQPRTRTRGRAVEEDEAPEPRRTRRDTATDSSMRGRELPAEDDDALDPPGTRARVRADAAKTALGRARERMR